ncbi:MAG: thiamine pyrophosphate-binding protein, partial [bacterium]|nr:thiamine pyrophosphate-binding protein [bacterium]
MKTFNKKISVAEYIADFISSLGVDIVPFVQGGAIMKIIDSVGQHKKLKYVACNHEQAVAMFVDGYARVKGFGVGMATSGPGGTNMLTGIACAYYDSIPCLFITGQVGMFHIKGDRKIRQRGFQETDIVSMAKPVTKHSEMVVKGEDVRYVFEKAVHMAKSGRPGPVLIDVPYNVQREMIIPEKLRSYSPSSSKSPFLKTSCEKEAKNILNILLKAERPVLFVGGGVRIAGEVKNTVKLASALKIPVVTTWGAIDVFSSSEPLYLGSPGRYGNISANEIVEKSDVALSLGSRFTTKVIHNDKIFSHNTKVIAVDIDRGELNEGLLPHWRTIQVDLREFLPVLLRQSREVSLNKEKLKKWLAFARELKSKSFDINIPPKSPESHVNPYTFGRVLSRVLGKKDIITSDCGL